MGKNKKHRAKKNKENDAGDTSEDGVPTCSHITKAVNFAAMRKVLLRPASKVGECTACALQASKGQIKEKGVDKETVMMTPATGDEEPPQTTIWVCLQCGHQGCDRNSQDKHALKHYETPHCGIHCLVINLTTWATWCYACDDEVPLESKRIQECMDFLYKQTKASRVTSPQRANNSNLNSSQTRGQSEGPVSSTKPQSSPSVVITPQAGGKSSDIACQRVKGLNNLGNTCFFNAVMQNMCQTPGLEALLVERCNKDFTTSLRGWRDGHSDSASETETDDEDESRWEELSPIEVEFGEAGPLSLSLRNFVQEMSTSNGKNTVSPSGLFSNVCKKAPRFRGFQQQDSHELLRYMIDVLRNEEIKRAQQGILKQFKLPDKVNRNKVDEDVKMKIKEFGRQAKFTFVDSLFGGQLVSTITCEECSHVSQVVESFLDLSLSVTEEKPQRPNQILGGRHTESAGVKNLGEKKAEEDDTPLKGVDGFAEHSGKPSKYQERKNRKQAKKEAKKKGRMQNMKNLMAKNNSNARDEDDDTNDKETMEEEGKGEQEGVKERVEGGDRGDMAGQTREEDKQRSQEENSDADVEDNLESEVSMSQGTGMDKGDNLSASTPYHGHAHPNTSRNLDHHSNLPDSQDSEEEDPHVSLCIKSGTQKETHILPRAFLQSGDSHLVSPTTECTGIKERKHCEIEKLANDVNSLTLNDSGLGRTEGGSDEPSAFNYGGRGDAGTDVSVSSPEARHSVTRDDSQTSQHCNIDCNKADSTGSLEPVLITENGSACVETDENSQHTISGNKNNSGCDVYPPYSGSAHGQNQGASDQALTNMYKVARQKSKMTLAARYQPSSKECSVMSCLNQFTSAELLTGPNRVKCRACTKAQAAGASPVKDKKGKQAVYCNASKQYLILIPPAVLTLHFKRFEQVGFGCRKVNRHVEFPTLLDIAPYCSALCQHVRGGQREVLYSLYGVVEHSGRLHGGHYTAYVKVRPGVGPVNSFLRSQQSKPHDFIHKYVERLCRGMVEAQDICAAEPEIPEGRWFHISDSSVSATTEARVLSAQAYLLFYERIC